MPRDLNSLMVLRRAVDFQFVQLLFVVRTGVTISKLLTCQIRLSFSSHGFQNLIIGRGSEVSQAELKSWLFHWQVLV